jgi:hypothetical protein
MKTISEKKDNPALSFAESLRYSSAPLVDPLPDSGENPD